MTTVQLNAEVYRTMGVIAEDEGLLRQALKYLKKLAAKKQDETLMTREQFFARVDEAKQGKSATMLPGENLSDFLRRQEWAMVKGDNEKTQTHL
jgi:C4-type Zn-finger protein